MTGRPSDDDLREMLESRASRVSPDTNREAMAGVRAAMRGTADASGGFAVLPVAISGRGARLPGSVAAIGLVAVLIVAVVGGRLSSPQEGAASGAAGTHVPESIPTLAVSGPDSAAVPPEAVPESWTGAELATALGARSIVGQMVVVDGPFTTRLCNPGGSCVVDIDGLEGVRVVFPHAPQGVPPLIGPGSRTVLRVREDGGLDYLGQIVADAQRPLTVNALVHEYSTPGRALFVVGQLWQRATDDIGMSCPATGPLAPSCVPDGRSWLLAGVDPLGGDASRLATGMVVTLGNEFVQGSAPSTAPSTFLVSSLGGGWQVDGIVAATIAQHDTAAGSSAPSAAPTPSGPPIISLPAIGGMLSPDELNSRLADGSLDGRIVVIEGELTGMFEPCPSVYGCFALVLPGGSVVSIDADPTTSAELERRLPGPGELVFAASHGVLNYLGPEPADVDHPISVAQLMTFPQTPDLMLVSGWLVTAGPMFCALIEPGGTPCPSAAPWLTDDHPARDGALASGQGIAVSLLETPVPVEPDTLVTEGPFLVRGNGSSCAPLSGAQPAGGQPAACPLLPRILWEIVGLLGPSSPQRSPLP